MSAEYGFDGEARGRDAILCGGENISTLEIEEVLYLHGAVMEAAVVARPDEERGEIPCAFVVLKPDAPLLTEAEIIDWCRSHLPESKCPRHVVFSDLPKSATGKVRKHMLREWAKNS